MSRARKPEKVLQQIEASRSTETGILDFGLSDQGWSRICALLPSDCDQGRAGQAVLRSIQSAKYEMDSPKVSKSEMVEVMKDLRSKAFDVRRYLGQTTIRLELMASAYELQQDDHPLSEIAGLVKSLAAIEREAARAVADITQSKSVRKVGLHVLGAELHEAVQRGDLPLTITKYHDQKIVELFQICCEELGVTAPDNCLHYLIHE